ncbi:MAG: RDD family protein [Chloroflexi bacterium]|nr:RDD family protein [Chloroflexota bacterium]
MDGKVVDDRGNPISFGRATGRYFGKIVSALILLIGLFMAAFTARKQALHDMMAGTLVVKRPTGYVRT